MLAFANNGTHLPDSHYDPESQSGHLYFHLEQLAYVVDVLRNEAPVYGVINPETGFVGLQTGQEPIGEHERPAVLRA